MSSTTSTTTLQSTTGSSTTYGTTTTGSSTTYGTTTTGSSTTYGTTTTGSSTTYGTTTTGQGQQEVVSPKWNLKDDFYNFVNLGLFSDGGRARVGLPTWLTYYAIVVVPAVIVAVALVWRRKL
jgi:hypothetical protein